MNLPSSSHRPKLRTPGLAHGASDSPDIPAKKDPQKAQEGVDVGFHHGKGYSIKTGGRQ